MRTGDHRDQALAETMAVLIGIRLWRAVWALRPCRVQVKSDSTAAIGAIRKLRSKAPGINAVVRELSLTIATTPTGLTVDLRHLPGVKNAWADALSRLAEPGSGAVVPGPLRALAAATQEERGPGWWKACGVQGVGPEAVVVDEAEE